MARRGYFENQDGNFRLRIVEPGYDADDPTVSPNNVIIDSHSLGTLSVVRADVGTIPDASAYQSGHWVASGWGLPYVPLCTFLFGYPDSGGFWNTYPSTAFSVFRDVGSRLEVTADGIYVKGTAAPTGLPLQIHYTAYRLPV